MRLEFSPRHVECGVASVVAVQIGDAWMAQHAALKLFQGQREPDSEEIQGKQLLEPRLARWGRSRVTSGVSVKRYMKSGLSPRTGRGATAQPYGEYDDLLVISDQGKYVNIGLSHNKHRRYIECAEVILGHQSLPTSPRS